MNGKVILDILKGAAFVTIIVAGVNKAAKASPTVAKLTQ